MNVLAVGLKALRGIIDNKKPEKAVASSLDEEFNLSSQDYLFLRKTINGSLKHFYLLRYQAGQLYQGFADDDDETYLLILAIYQIRYCAKTVAPFLTVADALKASSLYHLRFESGELQDKLNSLKEQPFSIPEEIKNDPFRYNSLFFSIPEWIIRMWNEQYGEEITMNLLRESLRQHPFFVRCIGDKAFRSELIKSGNYSEVGEDRNALIYSSASDFTSDISEKGGFLFPLDLSLQLMLDSLVLPKECWTLQINGSSGALASSLALLLKKKGGFIDVSFESAVSYRKAVYQFARLGLDKAYAKFGNLSELAAQCRYDNYSLVLCTPHSSGLGKISAHPSLLASLSKKDLDVIKEGEKEALEEAYRYLAPGGQIVYAVETLNQDEAEKMIGEFISTHQGIYLLSEKQIFPYDYSSNGLYYAVVQAGEQNGR